MYNLTIGICSGGTLRAETVTSLIGAMDVVKDKGIPCYLTVQIGGYVALNRNKVVETAQRNKSTHLMFIDADMVFPPSGILRLIDHDKDIVGAMYNTRGNRDGQGVLLSTVKLADKKGNLISADSVPAQLFKCYGLGTGFMLIKMPVFDKLKAPYFEEFVDSSGEHHTEDIEFCKRAGESGFDVWCSPTIKMGHIGSQEF